LSTDRDGARAVITVKGELDAYSAPSLEEETSRLLADNTSDLVLDLSGTRFLDSSGLRAILTAQRRLVDQEGRLALRAPSEPVRRLLDITGLTDHFAIES
jgi:anti-anti-sigma factor